MGSSPHVANHYQEVTLTSHKKLNLERQPCEEDPGYIFSYCVRESLSKMVGCRLPWDKWSKEERNVCTNREQFREFEQLFKILLDADMSKITRTTGCKKPCSYKEYKFINTNLKELSYYTCPKDQIAFCLWAVSQNTYIEEEVLVYSFESLIAELGGSL